MLNEVREIHSDLKLVGRPRNSLLDLQDHLLFYVLSILRNESPEPPGASQEEWEKLLSVLFAHNIIPLIYWKISSFSKEKQPPEYIIERMRDIFLKSSFNNLIKERQLFEIIKTFEVEKIQSLVLKGIAFARAVYPDSAIRSGGDIDLLVKPEDVLRAREVMQRIGYNCFGEKFEVSRNIHFEEALIPKNKNYSTVEIHWNLHLFSKATDQEIRTLFRRAVEVEADGFSFKALHPIDAIINAALHMNVVHNQDIRLIWICDIAMFLKRLKFEDWQILRKRSVEWRARTALEKAVKMAGLWFGIELPEEFSGFSSWPEPTEAETRFWKKSLKRHKSQVALFSLFPLPSGISGKVRVVIKLIFPSPNLVRNAYPPPHPWLLPLSYIRRWVRWISPLFLRKNR